MAAKFRIGTFSFISLSQLPSLPTRRTSREVRPGLDGVTIWRGGRVAAPIAVESAVEADDVTQAIDLVRQYEQIVGESLVDVEWGGSPLNGVRALVSDVIPLPGGVHATVLGVGGVRGNGTSKGMCRCVWILNIVSTQQ
jgi:hypothetical protein